MFGRFCSVSVLLAVCLCSASGFAQQPPARRDVTTAAAESLFLEALALMEAGDFESAAQKLERSVALDAQPGTLLNLGISYEKLGRTASAWHAYRSAATVAAKEGDPRERRAREAAERIEPSLARLGIRVPAENRLPGLVIRRDGSEISTELLGELFPVDPGPTRIAATAPGHVDWAVTVDAVTFTDPQWVEVPKLPPVATPTSPRPSAPAPRAEARTEASPPRVTPTVDRQRAGLPRAAKIVGYVALVECAAAAGLALAAVASDRAGDKYCDKFECEPRGETLRNRGVAFGNASAWVAAAGGITWGLAVGITWGTRIRGAPSTVRVLPLADPNGGAAWR